ncbi:VOC family protein [Agrobacterium bohemicum]|uniref:VOC family protein n=1 Tax=Agrobacterium bohemicum TaxID=2052828 RepID=UPI0009E74860|nr:VOC family protein [Agrobacterium bohemicum]
MNRPRLCVELFVADIATSKGFYTNVLEFVAGPQGHGGYTPLSLGDIHLSLNNNNSLPEDHPTKVLAGERAGRGVEIVIEVEDLQSAYDRARASGWPISGNLTTHPWGVTDFRIVDPDGYYLRLSKTR